MLYKAIFLVKKFFKQFLKLINRFLQTFAKNGNVTAIEFKKCKRYRNRLQKKMS